jgi:hypothetical protein
MAIILAEMDIALKKKKKKRNEKYNIYKMYHKGQVTAVVTLRTPYFEKNGPYGTATGRRVKIPPLALLCGLAECGAFVQITFLAEMDIPLKKK